VAESPRWAKRCQIRLSPSRGVIDRRDALATQMAQEAGKAHARQFGRTRAGQLATSEQLHRQSGMNPCVKQCTGAARLYRRFSSPPRLPGVNICH